MNVVAAALVICYYIAMLVLGFLARKKVQSERDLQTPRISSESSKRHDTNFFIKLVTANRSLSLAFGVGSMTASWVGGGYLNGTSEAIYKKGILHCWTPLGYALSLIIGGTFFSHKMRALKPVTMLDPFSQRYGRGMALLLCVPAVTGEVLWTAAILAALGDTATVILELDASFFVVASAMVAFSYTSLGGFYAVTYTDILQISLTAVCLHYKKWMCVPACLMNKAVGTVGPPLDNWVGTIGSSDLSPLLDRFLMTALGGIPWQAYFQRVLSCETDFDARMLSYFSALACVALTIPPVAIAAAAKTANFTAAGYRGPYYLRDKESVSVLPYSLRYLTPGLFSMLGLLGITAAIMSSVDSSMLSASLLVTKNIYKALVRPMASDAEVLHTIRMAMFLIGAWATYFALSVESIFEAWSLCSDVVYVLLFPQLLCCLYFAQSNAYGSLLGFIVGCSFRWLFGESSQSEDEELSKGFPVRLISMTLGVVVILFGSYVAQKAFEKRWLTQSQDVFRCFRQRSSSRDYQPGSVTNVLGSKSAAPPEAPIPESEQQGRRASRSSNRGSEASMDDGAPNADTIRASSSISKAISVSRKSSTMMTSRGDTEDLRRRRSNTSVPSATRHGSVSYEDLSKANKGEAAVEGKHRSSSMTDLRTNRRHSSASLPSAPKVDTKHDAAGLPMKSAQSNPKLDAEFQVKREARQAGVSQTPKKRHRSKAKRRQRK